MCDSQTSLLLLSHSSGKWQDWSYNPVFYFVLSCTDHNLFIAQWNLRSVRNLGKPERSKPRLKLNFFLLSLFKTHHKLFPQFCKLLINLLLFFHFLVFKRTQHVIPSATLYERHEWRRKASVWSCSPVFYAFFCLFFFFFGFLIFLFFFEILLSSFVFVTLNCVCPSSM